MTPWISRRRLQALEREPYNAYVEGVKFGQEAERRRVKREAVQEMGAME